MSNDGISRRMLLGSTVFAAAGNVLAESGLALPLGAVPPGRTAPTDMGSVFPAGAVYFRKTNPPAEDWDRDYRMAAQSGMNTFRHWFMWSAIEIAPGRFDWADYDRQMDLAARNGLKVIIAVIDASAPEWAFRKFAAGRYVASDGTVDDSVQSASSASGGTPGLCLDDPAVKNACGRFISALVRHYRNHPALLGYDVWNETAGRGGVPPHMYCFCHGTQARFRAWLKGRYGALEAVNKAWHRYSYVDWDEIEPPRDFTGYPESLDWLQFRVDNAYTQFDWRIDLIRKLDPTHLVVCHGTALTLDRDGTSTTQEWQAAKRVDVYGYTWIASRQGAAAWKQYQAVDLVRAGARGKPFWHAEATGGPLWLQPQLAGRPREDGRSTDADDVRLNFMVSCAAGARGFMFTRWRGLLDGPLFGAFGLFAMDGSPTPQSAMADRLFRWANQNASLWSSRPVRGDVGILFAEESEFFNVVQQKSADYYAASVKGAYQAFFDSNVQADFVAPENIGEYKLIYLAYPLMLKSETVARLQHYVAGGGALICEGFPAYFGDRGHVGTVQPNFGLDRLFGCLQKNVEFAPDLAENLQFELYGAKIFGRYFRQDYTLAGGKAVGHFEDGAIAAVENGFGAGRVLLMGTFPGGGYFLHRAPQTRQLFQHFLAYGGISQRLRCDTASVQARLHEGSGGTYLWATNATSQPQNAVITVDRDVNSATDVWMKRPVAVDGRRLTISLPPKDAAVVLLG